MIDSQSIEICQPDTELINKIAQQCRCSNLLAHLLINRGLKTVDQVEKYFRADSEEIYAAEAYPGVAEAVELIVAALKKEEKIFIILYGEKRARTIARKNGIIRNGNARFRSSDE